MNPRDIRRRLSMPDGSTPSQAEFAAAIGVHVQTVSKWETGARVPEGAALTLYRLLDARPELFWELVQPSGDAE